MACVVIMFHKTNYFFDNHVCGLLHNVSKNTELDVGFPVKLETKIEIPILRKWGVTKELE
jgi:hypothetical protein